MCDSVVVTGRHTASGATLFAKNSDRHATECQPFLQFAGARHPAGSRVRCTHVEIAQVERTHRVMGHAPHWVWGFEHGVNEFALAIGNHTVFSREAVEEEPGLIGMDLVRLALERAASAQEALRVIAALVEAHGQGGSGFGPGEAGYHNSFTLADPREAWQLETSGRHWVARPVERGALGNQFCIGSDWTLASSDLEVFARAQGWAGADDAARLHVERAYRNPDVPARISEPRLHRSRAWLEASAKPDAGAAMALLRDHGAPFAEAPLHASLEDDARFTVCMHAEPVGTTTASLVAELPEDRKRPWPVWVGFASPCVGVFLPVYLDAVIPPALASRNTADGAWTAFHRLSAALEECALAGRAVPLSEVRDHWQPFERELEHKRGRAEAEAADAFTAGEDGRAREVLRAFMEWATAAALVHATALRERIGASGDAEVERVAG